MPVVEGCEINDDPAAPVCSRCRRLAADTGDDLPVTWVHRDLRYVEKLATPDTSVGDLVGDVDPVKVAEGRTLGDPETVHYGLIPRTNRGIFGINELPDLAERIQVAMFNVLEERDIQVRGYSLRLPLDLLLVASANPEDYTNRGRIITPLKDRFGAEIRTHYPVEVRRGGRGDRPGGRAGRPRAGAPAGGPGAAVAAACASRPRSTSGPASAPASPSPPPRGSPRARCVEPPAPATPTPWPASATCPPCCPPSSASSSSRWGRRAARSRWSATCCGSRSPRPSASACWGWTCRASPSSSPRARSWRPASWSPPRSCWASSGRCPGWPRSWTGSATTATTRPTSATSAAGVELVLEGLHLTRRVDKENVGGRTVYGA